jgi:hypothetical protein
MSIDSDSSRVTFAICSGFPMIALNPEFTNGGCLDGFRDITKDFGDSLCIFQVQRRILFAGGALVDNVNEYL